MRTIRATPAGQRKRTDEYGSGHGPHSHRQSVAGASAGVCSPWPACGQSRRMAEDPRRQGFTGQDSFRGALRIVSRLQGRIQRAIADLGSADFAVRERASRELWNAGAEAEPALEKAVRETDDFEVVYRARQILQSFQVGIYPDTPADIVALIGQFRMGNFNVKQNIVQRSEGKGQDGPSAAADCEGDQSVCPRAIEPDLLGPVGRLRVRPVMSSAVPRAVRPRADASELALEARVRLAQRRLRRGRTAASRGDQR